MNVSVAVMAHPSRRAWVADLQRELGDVPVAWATRPWATRGNRESCWRTKRAALLLHTDAPFHCVVQDDAILCTEFLERIDELVAHGEFVFSLFYRHKRTWPIAIDRANQALRRGLDHFVMNGNVLGVAVIVPTHWIADVISFCDELPAHLGDDDRMKLWARERGHETLFPLPSLVDHRVGPSLIGHPPERVAWRFAS